MSTPNSTSLTRCTVAEEKGPSYFAGICCIIKACKEADVLELHFEGLSLFRTQDANYFAFANRNPKKIPPSWEAPAKRGESPRTEILSTEEKDFLRAQEEVMHAEVQANLPLEDPVAWEKLQLEELEGKVRGVTAEQVAELDEEEQV